MSAPRRPWWLAFDRPGQAWWFLTFALLLGVGGLVRTFAEGGWISATVSVLLVATWAGMPIVSLIAYHRHPGWVGRGWAPRFMPRRRLRAFAAGTLVSLGLAIGAGIVAAATSSHVAVLAVAVGGVGVLVCASTVAAHDEAGPLRVDR